MPRITRDLPPNRSDWTFGDLVYWHLFKFGTKPKVDPDAKAGDLWEMGAICQALGHTEPLSERTIRNWINGKSLPDDISELCANLFGDNSRWATARAELQGKFEQGWAKRRAAKTNATAIPGYDEPEETPEAGPSAAGNAGAHDQHESKAEHHRDDRDKRGEVIVLHPVDTYPPKLQPRRRVSALVAGATVLLGFYVWTQSGREPEKKVATAPPSKVEVPVQPPPAPPLAPASQPQVAPAPQAAPVPQPGPPVRAEPVPQPVSPAQETQPVEPAQRPAPPVQQPAKVDEARTPTVDAGLRSGVAPSPRELTPAEQQARAEQERRRAEVLASIERERREQEQEAIRLDKLDGDPGAAQRQRDTDKAEAALLGFKLRENTSATGSSLGNPLASSVEECAQLCTNAGCDAFDFYRDQYGPGSTRQKYCYLFSKPFAPYGGSAGHVFGERISAIAPARVAQATPRTATDSSDGVVRCANGSVKVTGFRLECDRTLGGGTTLGSTRLSYSVANINECAAKCRPVQGCTSFTYNASDPDGQHACMIFGGRPEARESAGWISGTR